MYKPQINFSIKILFFPTTTDRALEGAGLWLGFSRFVEISRRLINTFENEEKLRSVDFPHTFGRIVIRPYILLNTIEKNSCNSRNSLFVLNSSLLTDN